MAPPKKQRKVNDEKRAFNPDWTRDFFSENRGKTLCLISHETLAWPKLFNVKRHYQTHHGRSSTSSRTTSDL